jgi:hypothetical protein
MADTYQLWFNNQSGNGGTACVYQGTGNVKSSVPASQLAWIVYGANPSTWIQFQWTLDLSFVWIAQGPPRTQQILPADVGTANSTTLSCNQFGYFFSPPSAGTAGALVIAESASVPAVNSTVAGIGMSGAGTFGVGASPNQTLFFTPAVASYAYWITFGQYTLQTGDVLNTPALNNPGQLKFPSGVQIMTAVLDESNQWTVTPGPPPKARIFGEVVVYQAGIGVVSKG